MKSEQITLYFKQGRSDKVYKAALEETDDHNFVVHFAYGRRGDTLKTGTKTKRRSIMIQLRKYMTSW